MGALHARVPVRDGRSAKRHLARHGRLHLVLLLRCDLPRCACPSSAHGVGADERKSGFSASFHTFTAHSMAVSHAWNRMDYIGIVVLITGTIIPCIRYGFFCSKPLQHFYLACIVLASSGSSPP